MLDLSTEAGKHADRRLREEAIIWLTTVRSDGQPQPVPIWFFWDGRTVLIYSQPNQQKIRNIRANPRVALNLNSTPQGGDIVRLLGTAEIPDSWPPATAIPEMIEKYRAAIGQIGLTPEGYAAAYSVAIRITPTDITVR